MDSKMARINKNIPVSELTHEITVNICITGCNVWRVKKFIGLRLIKLGVYIMGMNTKVVDNLQ